MKIRSLFLTAGLLACTTGAQAQSLETIPEYSGALQFSAPLILADGQSTAFHATLRTKEPAQNCLVFGKVWAVRQNRLTDKRILIVEQGSVSVACEGKSARRVFGDFVHSPADPAWEPAQKYICLQPGRRGSCDSTGSLVEMGTPGGWVTWHAIAQATNAKRQPKLP
jgi:hypothetical protein